MGLSSLEGSVKGSFKGSPIRVLSDLGSIPKARDP